MESCVHKPTDGRMTSAYSRTQNKTRPPQRKLKLGREATTGNASAVRRLLFQLLESAGEHLPDLTLQHFHSPDLFQLQESLSLVTSTTRLE